VGVTAGWSQRDSPRDSQRGTRGSRDTSANRNGSKSGVIDYRDISERNTQKTARDDKKEKAAEEAKKKAEEEKRHAERQKRYEQDKQQREGGKATSMSSSGGTSGTKTASRNPKGGGHATKPVNAGGSTDPTTREVTEVMLEAVKTQTVHFDPAKAKDDPGMLILNAPRYDSTKRVRAGDAGIASPL
jgi:penicillin-binding protein 1A